MVEKRGWGGVVDYKGSLSKKHNLWSIFSKTFECLERAPNFETFGVVIWDRNCDLQGH